MVRTQRFDKRLGKLCGHVIYGRLQIGADLRWQERAVEDLEIVEPVVVAAPVDAARRSVSTSAVRWRSRPLLSFCASPSGAARRYRLPCWRRICEAAYDKTRQRLSCAAVRAPW